MDIVCPNCGQAITVDAAHTGATVECPNCGQSVEVAPSAPIGRAPRPSATAQSTPPTPGLRYAEDPDASSATHPGLRNTSDTGVTARRPSSARYILLTLVLALAAGTAGYFLRGSASDKQPTNSADADWEQSHRPEILRLKSDAEARVIAGDLKGGHEKYRELQVLAGSHPIKDPVLFDAVQNAKDAQERVYAMLLTQRETTLGYYNPTLENPPPTTRPAASNAPERPNLVPPEAPLPNVAEVVPSTQQQPPPDLAPYPPPPSTAPLEAAAPTTSAAVPGQSGVMYAPVLTGSAADRQITDALNRGVAFLLAKFKDGEITDPDNPPNSVRHQGLNALCVYALLHAAESGDLRDPRLNIHGPFLQNLIARMKSHAMATDQNQQQPVVYARSLRAAALAVFNRPEDTEALRADVKWLINAASDGAYTYDDRYVASAQRSNRRPRPGGRGDTRQPRDPQPTPGLRYAEDPDPVAPTDPDLRRTPSTALRAGSDTGVTDNGAMLLNDSTGASTILIHNGERPWIPPKGWTPPPSAPPGPPPPSAPPPMYLPPDEQPPATPYQPLQTDQPSKTPLSDYAEPAPWDNSNSQYGVLGVWAGAEAGVEVPTKYWKAVQQHWQGCELKTGEWFYAWINPPQTPTPTLQMTCAGIASLLITHDYLDAPALGNRVGRPPYSPNLSAGLSWLEGGDNVINVVTENMFYVGYNLYGIERCALASGYKYFGTHDWFAELSGQVLPNQFPNGAWGRTPDGEAALIDTSYMVLFLSRGRHPVIMNKLRFDPFWDNRPRDLANLAKFASRELERPLNWQVVNLQRDWSDWMDAPILYIASHQAPKLEDGDYDKLRSFAEAGGMIFTHADSAAPAFNNWVDATTKRLFPQYALRDVPGDHELFSVNYKLKNPTHLKMVTNGTRLLWVHSPVDISPAWQERGFKTSLSTFQLGVNLFVWAAGRGDFRNRLDSPYIPEPSGDPQQTITVARLKYGDGVAWNPEPYAWTRFGRILQTDTGAAVKTVDVDLKDLTAGGDYKLAAMTGNAATDFSDEQIKAVSAFVESGGTLLIDACGGSTDFATSVEQKLFAKAFPNTPLRALPADDPIATDAAAPAIRQYAIAKLGSAEAPPLRQLTFGKGRVIYSPLDLTTGMLGTNSWGILGYTPTYSIALVKRVVSAARAQP